MRDRFSPPSLTLPASAQRSYRSAPMRTERQLRAAVEKTHEHPRPHPPRSRTRLRARSGCGDLRHAARGIQRAGGGVSGRDEAGGPVPRMAAGELPGEAVVMTAFDVLAWIGERVAAHE